MFIHHKALLKHLQACNEDAVRGSKLALEIAKTYPVASDERIDNLIKASWEDGRANAFKELHFKYDTWES